MIDYLNIAFTVLFSQNLLLVFTFSFGADPKTFLNPRHAFLTGLALTAIMVILTPISRVVYQGLEQIGMTHFSLLCYALLSTVGTYHLGVILEKISPDLWKLTRESMMALPTNAGILGVILLSAQYHYSPLESFVFALFGGIGVLMSLVSLVGIRQTLDSQYTPEYFRGLPILFVTAGLMSLSLMGFYGLYFP